MNKIGYAKADSYQDLVGKYVRYDYYDACGYGFVEGINEVDNRQNVVLRIIDNNTETLLYRASWKGIFVAGDVICVDDIEDRLYLKLSEVTEETEKVHCESMMADAKTIRSRQKKAIEEFVTKNGPSGLLTTFDDYYRLMDSFEKLGD